MFYSFFFLFSSKVPNLSFSHSFIFILWVYRDGKVQYSAGSLLLFLLLLLIISRSGSLAEITWSVCITKSLGSLCVSFSRTYSELCIYHIIIHSLELFTSALADGFFTGGLSDSKSPQVSRTLICILAVLNNAVVWMVSTCPSTSKSSSHYSTPLVTVPNAPITIACSTVFFNSLARSRYLSLFSYSFSFYSVVSRGQQSQLFCKFFFCLFFCFVFFFFC